MFLAGAGAFADLIAPAFGAFGRLQPRLTGVIQLAKHRKHAHPDKEQYDNLENHLTARNVQSLHALLDRQWRLGPHWPQTAARQDVWHHSDAP